MGTTYMGGIISGTSALWIVLSLVIRLKDYPEQAAGALDERLVKRVGDPGRSSTDAKDID